MSIPVQRSIRLSPFTASSLDRSSGTPGGIFYDQNNQTLRITNGSTNGGTILATRPWVASTQANLVTISELETVVTASVETIVGGYVSNVVNQLIDNAPAALDTLNELAAALGDDANFASTVTTALSLKANTSSLATIATTGSYNDLVDKPSIPSLTGLATVATSGSYLDLLNRPALASVATSGSYLDLTNKPSAPTSLGFALGVAINEFSTDTTMGGNSDLAVPTEKAVKAYVDGRISTVSTSNLSLDNLTDVVISGTLTAGQVLKYNGTNWVAGTDATAGGAGSDASTLNGQSGSYYLNYNNLSGKPDLTLYAPLDNPNFTGTVAGVTATHVGLGNVTNESKATMFTSPTFTGTVSGITAEMVGLGNVTNESKATMFTNPTFTGTVSGIPEYTASSLGLGNVTNESKATMFANSTLTGTTTVATVKFGDNSTMTTAPSAPGVVMLHHGQVPPQGLQGYTFGPNLKDKSVYKRYQIHITGMRHPNNQLSIGYNAVVTSTGNTTYFNNYTWAVIQQIYHNNNTPTVSNLNGTSGQIMQIAPWFTNFSYPSATDVIIDAEYFEYQANSGRWRFKCYSTAQYTGGYIRQEAIYEYSFSANNYSSFPGFILIGPWENYADNIYKPTVTLYGYR